MRANQRMTADELMIAQVVRAQELRRREVMPDEYDLDILAYLSVLCIVLTLILTVLFVA